MTDAVAYAGESVELPVEVTLLGRTYELAVYIVFAALRVETVVSSSGESFNVERKTLAEAEVNLQTTTSTPSVELVVFPSEGHLARVGSVPVAGVLVLEAMEIAHTEDGVEGYGTVGVVTSEERVNVHNEVETSLSVIPLVGFGFTVELEVPAILAFPAAHVYTSAKSRSKTIAYRNCGSGSNHVGELVKATERVTRTTLKLDSPVRVEFILGTFLCGSSKRNCCESSYEKSSKLHNRINL